MNQPPEQHDPERAAFITVARSLGIPIQSSTAWEFWQAARQYAPEAVTAKPQDEKGPT